MNRKTIIGVALLTLGVAVAFIYYKNKNTLEPKQFYSAQKTQQKHLQQFVTASGTLKARDQITVGALVAGRIIDVSADDNDEVKKGDLLVTLDDGIGDSAVKQFTARLEAEKAQLEYQVKNYARQKDLYEAEQLSQDQFDLETRNLTTARAAVKATEAELEIRQKEYDNLFIRAPESGTVISRQVDLGEMITARFQATELFIIARDLQLMEGKINVDEADVGMVKEKDKVFFTVDAFPDKTFHANVKQIQYFAENIENVITYATLLDVTNEDLSLRPGMTINAEILVAEDEQALSIVNRALRINKRALQETAKKIGYEFKPLEQDTNKIAIDNVWIVQDASFIQKQVTLGVTDKSETQIVSGIEPDDDIVTDVLEQRGENLLIKQVFGGGAGGIGKK